MNTQLAINLLTETQNSLTATLAALGLLSNGETIISLKQKIEQNVEDALEKQQQLSSDLDTFEGKLQLVNEELALAVSHNSTEQERLLELKKERGELQIAINTLKDKKEIIASNGDDKKAEMREEINNIKDNIASLNDI